MCHSVIRAENYLGRNQELGASLFHTSSARYEEVKTVKCPPFAESITEGDVRWEVEVGDAVAEDQVKRSVKPTEKKPVAVVKRWFNGWTEGRTVRPSHRDAWTHLITVSPRNQWRLRLRWLHC